MSKPRFRLLVLMGASSIVTILIIGSMLLNAPVHAGARSLGENPKLIVKDQSPSNFSILPTHVVEIDSDTGAFAASAGGNISGTDKRARMKNAADKYDSGLQGTTHSKVVSGVPGGPTTGGPASLEFAIAPIENDKPSYNKAVFVKSDKQGKYKVSLAPGKYWIGPKAKALDPIKYTAGAFSFTEEVVVVKQGSFGQIDLFQVGYAP